MKQKKDRQTAPMEKARSLSRLGHPQTDPQGSWTGRPADPREEPVQDADDL